MLHYCYIIVIIKLNDYVELCEVTWDSAVLILIVSLEFFTIENVELAPADFD